MGKARKTLPVKLFFGFIFKDIHSYEQALVLVRKQFGRIDFESQNIPFTYTDYYREEFGNGLSRRFASAASLIDPALLYKAKIASNKIEMRLSGDSRRLVNIDPGYLNLSRLVLASTKDYYHRIYLNKGIFAELTLVYQHKSFRKMEWTYPDYQSQEYTAVFNEIRSIYAGQIAARDLLRHQ